MKSTQGPGWSVRGLIEAPIEQVWEILLDINPVLSQAQKQTVASANAPLRFTIIVGEREASHKVYIECDRQNKSIATQGEWWYRGVQTVELHEKGSLLVYRVYNVAPPFNRWIAQLMHYRYEKQMRLDLQKTIDAIGNRLACVTYLAS